MTSPEKGQTMNEPESPCAGLCGNGKDPSACPSGCTEDATSDPSPRDAVPAVVDPMGGNVPGGDPARVARYAEAIFEGRLPNPDGLPSWADLSEESQSYWLDSYGVAAVALADSEHAALVEEVRSMGRDALAEAQAYRALFAENERLREAAEAHWDARTLECPECGSGEEGCCVCSQMKRAEAAEAALAEARAQVEALTRWAVPPGYVGGREREPRADEAVAVVKWSDLRAALSAAAADTPEPASPDTASEGGRTTVAEAIAAWESHGPTSLTVALLADALYGVREAVDLCRHCDQPPESDGDHSCPCPHSDTDCPDHPEAAHAATHGHLQAEKCEKDVRR